MGSDTYEVIRTGTINAPVSEVYGHIVDFRKWEAWSPWADLDPDMVVTYTGPDAGVGAHYAWTGNRKAGAGSMEITEAVEDDHVTVGLTFLKPFKSEAAITLTLDPRGEATAITWRMFGHKTISSRIMGIFVSMDKMVGPDFEKGISQLKAVAEG
jgi:uncharacterized protein YndB with AHSA1/START domain